MNNFINNIIFRNDGIGDLIVSTPVILSLKKNDASNKIFLICSNRNLLLTQQLKKEGLIDGYYVFSDKNKSIFKIISLLIYIKKLKPKRCFVLRSSNTNYFISILSSVRLIYGIISLKSDKKNNKKITPFSVLVKSVNGTELIDSRYNYLNSINVHMSDHYLNVLRKSDNFDNNNIIKKYYSSPIKNENNFLENTIKILGCDYLILHIDEKWLRSRFNNRDYLNYILNIEKNTNLNILITFGNNIKEYNNYIFNFLKMNKVFNSDNIEIYRSNNYKNVYLFYSLNIIKLMKLVSNARLVITTEGGLTHISSMYNIPLINIIYIKHKNFLQKWLPKTNKYKQVEMKNLNSINNEINNFLKNFNN